MTASHIRITEFSDPGCPFAWSAEPSRLRLAWLFGDQVEWERRMVVLAESPDHYAEKGITPEMIHESLVDLAGKYGMPIDTTLRPRVPATADACRTVIATRINRPELEAAVLRSLRVEYFSGGMLDEPETIDAAVAAAGLDPEEVKGWTRQADTEQLVEEDKAMARNPTAEGIALKHKLAEWPGGWRYTCPSYEIERIEDGAVMTVPGIQPFESYEIALVNLVPDLDRRDEPEEVSEVLEWADTPLASQEVAAIMDVSRNEARERLSHVAAERPAGADGFWTLHA